MNRHLIMLFALAILVTFHAEGQTGGGKFQKATITFKDQTAFEAWIDADQLLKKANLTSRDSVFRRSAMVAVYSIQLDSNIYWIKFIGNRNDSIAVLSRAIDGKVSVYTPPLESGLEAVFVEKDSATYEMRQKIVEAKGKKFYRNEFRGFLKVFFSDCERITKAMVDKVPFNELRIMEIVSQYNRDCGWQKASKVNRYKAKFQIGLQLEQVRYNSTTGAYQNYFEGDRPASGFGLGLYWRLDFARARTAFLISELTFNQISGGGDITYYITNPTYQVLTEHHNFDIKELRNTYSAYFHLVRFKSSSLAIGGGLLFQLQLKNNSTVTNDSGTASSASPEDKFGLCPIFNALFSTSRFGVGYQMILMANQLKGWEGQHKEHKLFVQVRLSKK